MRSKCACEGCKELNAALDNYNRLRETRYLVSSAFALVITAVAIAGFWLPYTGGINIILLACAFLSFQSFTFRREKEVGRVLEMVFGRGDEHREFLKAAVDALRQGRIEIVAGKPEPKHAKVWN